MATLYIEGFEDGIELINLEFWRNIGSFPFRDFSVVFNTQETVNFQAEKQMPFVLDLEGATYTGVAILDYLQSEYALFEVPQYDCVFHIVGELVKV